MASIAAMVQAYEPSNLKRAWRWISSAPDAVYREYCARSYADFSLCPNELLDDINDRLKRGIYETSSGQKVYFPKKDRTLRTYTILSASDQVVYQALVNVIADRFDPIARPGYLRQSFGHLYAGKSSRTFYRDWRRCRRFYIGAAQAAVAAGLEYTATFDLTACYDSIGHDVIRYFLTQLGLDRFFCDVFCDYLNGWSANERGIRLGSGIPQGPLSSGLVAELILHYFDTRLGRRDHTCYLRYVDDIRLFGRSPEQLELLLRDLVAISKDIGLNPQGSKLDVHLVRDVDSELKSISSPREDWEDGREVDQRKLVRRILELTRRSRVDDDTRFKYALSHLAPCARLNGRLLQTLNQRQDLAHAIVKYFKKYNRLPRRTAEILCRGIQGEQLAPAVRGMLLDAADGRLPDFQDRAFDRLAKSLWKSRELANDVKVSVGKRLLKRGAVSKTQLARILRDGTWWTRSQYVRSLTDDGYARRDLAVLLTKSACDSNSEVALAAAVRVLALKLTPPSTSGDLHPFAARVLRQAKRRSCGVDHAFRKLLGKRIPRLPWKPFLGRAYSWFAEQALECEQCGRSNITAFVNVLDTLVDQLLFALFQRDRTIGTYQLGNVGGTLQNRRLAQKYPAVFKLARNVHTQRGRSRYSHAVHRASGKPTKTIHWRYLPTAKKLMANALNELASVI